jgi:hypothetical protein
MKNFVRMNPDNTIVFFVIELLNLNYTEGYIIKMDGYTASNQSLVI